MDLHEIDGAVSSSPHLVVKTLCELVAENIRTPRVFSYCTYSGALYHMRIYMYNGSLNKRKQNG